MHVKGIDKAPLDPVLRGLDAVWEAVDAILEALIAVLKVFGEVDAYTSLRAFCSRLTRAASGLDGLSKRVEATGYSSVRNHWREAIGVTRSDQYQGGYS